jgi:glycosyltransferase involved in cell wall biosynthesis
MSAVVIDHAPLPPAAFPPRPRRVCLITEAAGAGVGRHFLDLAGELAAREIDVTAIYSAGRCDAAFREGRENTRGVQFIELPMRRAIHPLDALDLSRLVETIRSCGSFDVIHGHSSKGGALARLAARRLGIPAVYTPHAFVTLDPTLSAWKRQFYGGIERWLACRTAAVIAVSRDEAAHAHALGIDPAKVHVVHNGIQPLELPPRDGVRESLGLSRDDFVIGFVGRLVPQKAPDLLIEAFAAVERQHRAARLVMIGSGPQEGAVRRQVQALDHSTRVLLLGDRIAPPLLPAFDVFCLPSRYEGMPYVLLEALAAGLPIVATRVGGVQTCVENGGNGLLAEERNARELADALLRLANDVSLRERMGAASRGKSHRFSVADMAEGTLGVYRHVLSLCARTTA